jgi:hypothetical protein
MSKYTFLFDGFVPELPKPSDWKGPKMFETPRFSTVEAALVQTYRIPARAVGAFRSRLGALQKAGLFGKNRPGKGRALAYGPDQFHRLIFVCELFEFGIAPAVVLGLVKSLWEPRLRDIFMDAEDAVMKSQDAAGPDDVILHMGGARLMVDGFSDAMPNVNSCPLSKLPDNMAMWMSIKPDDPSGLPPRAITTNLSMRLRAFHTALGISYMDELRAERAGKQRKRGRTVSKPTKR